MKDVKVLGPGCKRCEATERMVRSEAARLGLDIRIEKVSDYPRLRNSASPRRRGS